MLCECDPYSYTLQWLFFLIMCNSLANLRHARVAVELHASFVLNHRSKSACLLLLNLDMNNSRRKVMSHDCRCLISQHSITLSLIDLLEEKLAPSPRLEDVIPRFLFTGRTLCETFAGAFPDSLLFRQSGTRGVSVALLHAVAWLW
jgi:hypothetical protein